MQQDPVTGEQVDALYVLEARATELLDATRELRQAEWQQGVPGAVPPARASR